ncbi:MAG TPA: phage portal protein [Candidatus Accumulibacter sp.]|jgi:HK97 family phage portal protein|nr:phage portal protein [Accumulibacter sp.]
MSTATWYNAKRVSQPGSVILQEWNARRHAERVRAAGVSYPSSAGVKGSELYDWFTGGISLGSTAVTERSAMGVSAVYACVALIGGAIASLPLPIYRRTDGGRERANHPVWWLLNEQPHPDMSAAAFWEYLLTANLLYGDAFAEIVRTSPNTNAVRWLRPLHPRCVQVDCLEKDNGLVYTVTDPDGDEPTRTILGADMLHIPGVGFNGKRSLSPVRHAARNAVGIALAADEWSAGFFQNGARPDFALTTDGTLKPEQIDSLRDQWANRHAGAANRGKPVVMQGGLNVQPLTVPAEDAQLIETRRMQVEDIARIYGVPPHMIGHTTASTSWGSGIEQQAIGFVRFTLQRHLARIEQEINRKFWPRSLQYFAEFNVSGLERGDYKTRNEGYRVALGRAGEPGWMTINEVRRMENLPPLPEGDKIATVEPAAKTPDPAAARLDKAISAIGDGFVAMASKPPASPEIHNHIAAPGITVQPAAPAAVNFENHIAIPEAVVNVKAVMPEQAAPVVNLTVPETVVNVEAVLPEHAAPVVHVSAPDVRVETTVTPTIAVELPDRLTETTVTRDREGNIVKTVQIETSVES